MARTNLGIGRLIILALLALLAPLVAAVAPANADDAAPIPTTTFLYRTAYDSVAKTYVWKAHVSSASGVPKGTVTFYQWSQFGAPVSPDPVVAPITLDAKGYATATLPSTSLYRVEFTGTDGYADSADVPGDPRGFSTMTAEPTILKIGGPSLVKVNLTMSATFRYADGSPAEGEPVVFTLFSYLAIGHGTPVLQPYVVCTAWSDANGLASCGGQAAGAAIVSILTLGAYANRPDGISYSAQFAPIIAVSK